MDEVWLTDCVSLNERSTSSRLNALETKRLATDLMIPRQQFGSEMAKRHRRWITDYPRWIDTSVMLADPLAKAMNAEQLVRTMMTCRFGMQPTAESVMRRRVIARPARLSERPRLKFSPLATSERPRLRSIPLSTAQLVNFINN